MSERNSLMANFAGAAISAAFFFGTVQPAAAADTAEDSKQTATGSEQSMSEVKTASAAAGGCSQPRDMSGKSDDELRKMLTPEQYYVVREEGTERPFHNKYWDNKEAGIYVDVVSGEPLFSSLDKFDSGTGWPSFTKPIEKTNIVEKRDTKLYVPRTEVRSKRGDSHLGHLFNDGPGPTGLRYCINSSSLRFVPVAELEAEGYGEYRSLFEKAK